jgi:crotonobetainyl-CoA:carnitine CoA-transferase CaiB-like acyl-CoA transferase
MYDFDGRAPFDEPSGRQALGWGPYYRCYEAKDGWFFFASPKERAAALLAVAELADLVETPERELEAALAARFRLLPIAYWQRAFAGGSTGIIELGSLMKTRDQSLRWESVGNFELENATYRAIRHDQHPMGRWCDLVAPNAVRPSHSKITFPGPMPKYGANTLEILEELGFDDAEIREMLDSGAAAATWSERFLPE